LRLSAHPALHLSVKLGFSQWRPARFFDDDFDSGETIAPLFAIANAGAYQLSAVTIEELLCAFLTE
jgi:hypothetical protein